MGTSCAPVLGSKLGLIEGSVGRTLVGIAVEETEWQHWDRNMGYTVANNQWKCE